MYLNLLYEGENSMKKKKYYLVSIIMMLIFVMESLVSVQGAELLSQAGEEYGTTECFPYSAEEYYSDMVIFCEMTQGITLQRGDTFQQNEYSAFTVSGEGFNDITVFFNENGDMIEAQSKVSIGYSEETADILATHQTGNDFGVSIACMIMTSVFRENGVTELLKNGMLEEAEKKYTELGETITSVSEFLSDAVGNISEDTFEGVDEKALTKEKTIDSYGKAVVRIEMNEELQTADICCRWLPVTAN